MNQRTYLMKGTFFLTFAGLLTRTAGFFYKIFLSRTIGAREIGLYQLTLPVYAFCMAFACGGIQTAVSRFTAEYHAKKDPSSAKGVLLCSLLFSGAASCLCGGFLFFSADRIARFFLLEPACCGLLQIIAVSLPFSVLHTCIAGYFIGIKNVSVSGISQFIEQLLRIGSGFFFFFILKTAGRPVDARIMALGQVAGELASSLYCLCYLLYGEQKGSAPLPQIHALTDSLKKVLAVSVPLALNRMLLCILQGMEASLLPKKLQQFGLSSHNALASYGTMTGMALPLIMFPTALTSAIATLLLPTVSEAHALKEDHRLRKTIRISICSSFLMGLLFCMGFLVFGTYVGTLLFQSTEAGSYIRKLSFLCPFLYLNTTLTSVLHGLGKTGSVFLWNVIGFTLRLASVVLLVPTLGISGYFYGTIGSQIFLSLCTVYTLRGYLRNRSSV